MMRELAKYNRILNRRIVFVKLSGDVREAPIGCMKFSHPSTGGIAAGVTFNCGTCGSDARDREVLKRKTLRYPEGLAEPTERVELSTYALRKHRSTTELSRRRHAPPLIQRGCR